ncbi:LysR family transcriptional regulator [Pelistega europaea]|uniref:LysR family transcriptional regulator n=1 Tax=Pelistega europaea TaxID=106147 RepID=A0A7Y4L930_9BURK|nr:LysR family transcriptional regulator [Pelistega europaea]NOL49249.1 LysR family transcriptional regulator [Pelistega europaea]
MNISFRQLRAFVTVARKGSFTSAAESLFLTQSALSGLIKELEQTWEVKLFERTTRRLVLTSAGQELYPKAQQILMQIEEINTQAKSYRAIHQGRVRVACSQQLAAFLLPELIAEYQLITPSTHIDIMDCGVENVIPLVDEGEADWGIGPEREVRSNISSENLFSLPFHAVLKKEHRLAKQSTLTWAELIHEPLITLKGPFSERLAEQIHVSQQSILEKANKVNYMSTALSMVNAGLGITICLPYSKKQIDQYDLVMCKMVKPSISRKFYIFQRKSAVLSDAAQHFKDFVVSRLNKGKYFTQQE